MPCHVLSWWDINNNGNGMQALSGRQYGCRLTASSWLQIFSFTVTRHNQRISSEQSTSSQVLSWRCWLTDWKMGIQKGVLAVTARLQSIGVTIRLQIVVVCDWSPKCFRLLTSFWHVVLVCSLTSLMVILNPQGKMLHGASIHDKWWSFCVSSIFK